MTIFTRQRTLLPMEKDRPYVFDRGTMVMIEHYWKRVLAIARNEMDQLDLHTNSNDYHLSNSASFYEHQPSSFSSANSEDTHTRVQHRILSEQLGQRQSQQHNRLYDRERLMIQALDALFSLADEGPGYIAFLATMVQLLDPDCPVSMAFLSHIVDRATLPSKTTMASVSSALLSKLGFKYSLNYSYLSNTMATLDGDNKNHRRNSWLAQTQQPTTSANQQKQQLLVCEFGSHVDCRMKRNFLAILAILAEKFAGEMVHLLWTPDISVILFYFLASNDETWTVRLFALLVLEKFALTGGIKSSILQHPLHIQNTLRQAIGDSKFGGLGETETNNSTKEMAAAVKIKTDDDFANRTGISAIFNTLRKCNERSCVDWISSCMQKLSKRKPTSRDCPLEQGTIESSVHTTNDNHWHQQQQQQQQEQQQQQQQSKIEFMNMDKLEMEDAYDMYDDGKFSDSSDNISRYGLTEQEDAMHDRGYSFDSSWTTGGLENQGENSIGNIKSLVRLESSPQNAVMKRMELVLCAEWSLGHVFCGNTLDECGQPTWDLSDLNVVVNPFDATQHWKIGTNGLELRNDRLYFESIRATACVTKGRWYYEVLLVTEGIMQIGWCTRRCRFVPEDGYGVGDDQHGFAFDTYRSAVWANGSVVYPQHGNSQYKCRAGDVLGSYLDMDQGICSFYVNGKDVGSTVAFEHASSTSNDGGSEMEGLYPAFSLTTHQHILVNFGDEPWMYLPDDLILASTTQRGWKGINQADSMTTAFRQQLQTGMMRSHSRDCSEGDKREVDNDTTTMTTDTATLCSSRSQLPSGMNKNDTHNNDDDCDDWDGPLCTICFNEPKDTNLLPCGHGSWGATCTKILESCPLCRSKIGEFTKCADKE